VRGSKTNEDPAQNRAVVNEKSAKTRWSAVGFPTTFIRFMIKLAFNGELLPISAWSKKNGINTETIRRRLENGWEIERILTTPANPMLDGNKTVSKNDAELALNDMAKEQLHPKLAQLVQHYNGTKLGRFLRTHHRKAFDEWFDNVYSRDAARNGEPSVLR
jgi:hypothetical protein